MTNEQGLVSKPDSVTITVGSNFEGIIDSGNNINIQVQENSGNNVGDNLVVETMYSDSPIFQEQSTEQDSQVVSYFQIKIEPTYLEWFQNASL